MISVLYQTNILSWSWIFITLAHLTETTHDRPLGHIIQTPHQPVFVVLLYIACLVGNIYQFAQLDRGVNQESGAPRANPLSTISPKPKISFPNYDCLRDRPFNLKGGGGYGFLFRSEYFFGTTQELEYLFFFQNLTVGYMTKTLNHIIFFFLHQNQNIFFSNIGNQVKWSFPKLHFN